MGLGVSMIYLIIYNGNVDTDFYADDSAGLIALCKTYIEYQGYDDLQVLNINYADSTITAIAIKDDIQEELIIHFVAVSPVL